MGVSHNGKNNLLNENVASIVKERDVFTKIGSLQRTSPRFGRLGNGCIDFIGRNDCF